MRSRDLISGSVLLGLAGILFFQAIRLTLWEEVGPAEGFFPLCLSIVFAGLSLLIIFQAFFKPAEAGERSRIVAPDRGKFFAYLGLFSGLESYSP